MIRLGKRQSEHLRRKLMTYAEEMIVRGGVVALLLIGCSAGSTKSEDPPPAPMAIPPPTVCKQTDRMGTYLLTWTTLSGSCGPIASSLVSFAPQTPGDGGALTTSGGTCVIHSDAWSENDCRNDRSFSCTIRSSDQTKPGSFTTVTIDYVGFTRQETSNGSEIDGKFSVRADAQTGPCTGIYEVLYLRQ